MGQNWFVVLAVALALGSCSLPAAAQVPSVLVTIDEFGNGTADISGIGLVPLPAGLVPDPFNGGAPVLAYAPPAGVPFPLTVTPGDVLILEPGDSGQQISDVIRFVQSLDGDGIEALLFFYSDNTDSDAVPALADISGLAPSADGPPIFEEPNGIATWTPLPGQPGFLLSGTTPIPVTYIIQSDGEIPPIPEPVTLIGLTMGVGLAFIRKRRSLLGQR